MTRLVQARTSGQGLVEFALVLPVFLLLLFGLLDLGRGVLFFTELSNASRVGARVAIVNQSTSDDCSGTFEIAKCVAADVAVVMGLTTSDVDVTVNTGGSDCSLPSDCTATVTVGHRFELITPIISTIIGAIDLSATTTMVLERTYQNP